MKKYFMIIFMLGIVIFNSGCTTDNMENIDIVTTNYPNEYITKEIYGENSVVTSIYPDGINTDTYIISDKQKEAFAQKDLFIYNGLIDKERDLAVDLLDINPDLKIIDTGYILKTTYSPEELWLNPSSLLMMAQNIRLGLHEYIKSAYLLEDIDKNYEDLKLVLSEIDAEYRLTIDNADNKTLVVANSALKYLENFNANIICLDADATAKTINEVATLAKEGTIKNIYIFEGDELSDAAKELVEDNNITITTLHKLDNITDDERKNDYDYVYLINDNLEKLKQDLYK